MTQVRSSTRLLFYNVFTAGLFLALLAGCSSTPKHRSTVYGKVPDAEDVRPVAMMGEDKFFGGQINALVTVSQGLDGLARRGGWRTLGRTRVEAPDLQDVFSNELYDQEKHDLGETINKMAALQVTGSPLPPVMLRVQLTNTGPNPVEVDFEEFKSALGPFALRPSKITVPAGGRTGPEGVSSRLGVTSNEIPVTLTMTMDGKSETHVVLVKNVVVEPAPAPAKK